MAFDGHQEIAVFSRRHPESTPCGIAVQVMASVGFGMTVLNFKMCVVAPPTFEHATDVVQCSLPRVARAPLGPVTTLCRQAEGLPRSGWPRSSRTASCAATKRTSRPHLTLK